MSAYAPAQRERPPALRHECERPYAAAKNEEPAGDAGSVVHQSPREEDDEELNFRTT